MKLTLKNNMQPDFTWVLWDDSLNTEILAWGDEQAITQLIAKLPAFWPIYRGFNQMNTERFWYACIIVSFLRSWFTLFNPKEDFTNLMYDLCDHLEKKGLWNPKAWGYVSKIGEEFTAYMNARFPDKKIWMTRIADGISAMGGCLKRNIPVITAYYTGAKYNALKWDGVITEQEAQTASKGQYGHCVTFTGLWPLWVYREIQDNYEGREGNTYKVYWFPFLKAKTWQANCFFVILPQDTVPVPVSLRHKYI